MGNIELFEGGFLSKIRQKMQEKVNINEQEKIWRIKEWLLFLVNIKEYTHAH